MRDEVQPDVTFVGPQGAGLDVLAPGEPVGQVRLHRGQFGRGDVQVQRPPNLVRSGDGSTGLDGGLDQVAGLDGGVRVGGVGDGERCPDAVQDGVRVGSGGVGAVAEWAAGAVGAGGDFDLPVPVAVSAGPAAAGPAKLGTGASQSPARDAVAAAAAFEGGSLHSSSPGCFVWCRQRCRVGSAGGGVIASTLTFASASSRPPPVAAGVGLEEVEQGGYRDDDAAAGPDQRDGELVGGGETVRLGSADPEHGGGGGEGGGLGVRRPSRRRARKTAKGALWSCQRTRQPAHRPARGTDQGSNKPTRPPVRLLSRQQEQRSQVQRAERAAPCRAGSGLVSA